MLRNLRNRHFFLIDLFLLSLTPSIALSLRLQLPWDDRLLQPLLVYTGISLVIKLGFFLLMGIYRQFWRYASIGSLLTIVWGVGASSVITIGMVYAMFGFGILSGPFPRSVPFIDGMLTLIVVGGTRLSLRVLEYQSGGGHANPEGKRLLIAGAGDAGQVVAREIHHSRYITDYLVGFVDDDPAKQGTLIHGVPVLGALDELPHIVQSHQVDEVVIAMPTAEGAIIRQVLSLCEEGGVSVKTLPGIFELISGEVSFSRLREVQIGDLLRRDPVKVHSRRVEALLRDKRVLVTGGGGSIGAELCEQIARCNPSRIIALGHGENSLFRLPDSITAWSNKIKKDRLDLIVADIRDSKRMDAIFNRFQPEVVYHAAAHKHVPLMEDNLEEAVTNNIEGTRSLVHFCQKHDVDHLVLISTDKAVEPTSVMGMTKRVAEKIILQAARESSKAFVTVRFGNVLGSRGSVIPLFQGQIAAGGPVTITHPEMERYFMTIQEAVQLVLQASALGECGEIFVLDMGEQVNIMDLANDLITLSGLTPGEDIEISFTGLRPGEKLSEKLYSASEEPYRTEFEKILALKTDASDVGESFNGDVDELIQFARDGKRENALQALKKLSD
jgi:FlaA1/EpsC-like NDP-sugar epimerase